MGRVIHYCEEFAHEGCAHLTIARIVAQMQGAGCIAAMRQSPLDFFLQMHEVQGLHPRHRVRELCPTKGPSGASPLSIPTRRVPDTAIGWREGQCRCEPETAARILAAKWLCARFA
ncbi:hypothetical protein LSUCC0246_01835 [Rhodobacterales bacterium LSUCC0246]|nr:hypothetical protein [Rhodobacterales bacterium LSUCC0374]